MTWNPTAWRLQTWWWRRHPSAAPTPPVFDHLGQWKLKAGCCWLLQMHCCLDSSVEKSEADLPWSPFTHPVVNVAISQPHTTCLEWKGSSQLFTLPFTVTVVRSQKHLLTWKDNRLLTWGVSISLLQAGKFSSFLCFIKMWRTRHTLGRNEMFKAV